LGDTHRGGKIPGGIKMLEELKQRGGKFGVKRSLIGILGILVIASLCYLDVFGLGAIPAILPWFLPVAGGLVILGSVRNWVKVSRGSITKGIEKFCKKTPDPAATMAQLEKTWRAGFDFTVGRMDDKYIIFVDRFASAALTFENAVWVWKSVWWNKGINYYKLMVYYNNGELEQSLVFTDPTPIDRITEYVFAHFPYIAVGENKETEKLRKEKNMSGFKEYALAQRAGVEDN
jgi:hypothetical protein